MKKLTKMNHKVLPDLTMYDCIYQMKKLPNSILNGKFVEQEGKVVSPYTFCTNTTKSLSHLLAFHMALWKASFRKANC